MQQKKKDIWFSSDLHMFHSNILTFVDYNGNKVREFDNVDQMNQHILEKHNSVVKPGDTWYCLGDVCFGSQENLAIFNKFNGDKKLILGNHDRFQASEYSKYFQIIYAGKKLDDMILSHYPIHPECLGLTKSGKSYLNVHGHVHRTSLKDKRYYNVSVEVINYTPVHIDEIKNYIKDCL